MFNAWCFHRITFSFLINQPDALIIPILFCYKTLHFSGIFSAHHQEFSTVHSALVRFMQVSDDRFQAELVENQFHPDSAWNKIGIMSASGWLFKKIFITMHGNMNVKQNSNFTSYTECIPNVM
jgi:hypothetical protein